MAIHYIFIFILCFIISYIYILYLSNKDKSIKKERKISQSIKKH